MSNILTLSAFTRIGVWSFLLIESGITGLQIDDTAQISAGWVLFSGCICVWGCYSSEMRCIACVSSVLSCYITWRRVKTLFQFVAQFCLSMFSQPGPWSNATITWWHRDHGCFPLKLFEHSMSTPESRQSCVKEPVATSASLPHHKAQLCVNWFENIRCLSFLSFFIFQKLDTGSLCLSSGLVQSVLQILSFYL